MKIQAVAVGKQGIQSRKVLCRDKTGRVVLAVAHAGHARDQAHAAHGLAAAVVGRRARDGELDEVVRVERGVGLLVVARRAVAAAAPAAAAPAALSATACCTRR